MASSRYPAYDEPPAAAAGPPPGGVTNELVDPETLYTKQGQIGRYFPVTQTGWAVLTPSGRRWQLWQSLQGRR